MAAGGTTILGPNGPTPKQAHFPFDSVRWCEADQSFPTPSRSADSAFVARRDPTQSPLPEDSSGACGHDRHCRVADPELDDRCRFPRLRLKRPLGGLALTTKESLLKFGHLGFEHVDLGPQFLSTLDGALMLGAVIMSLLPQSDYFGSMAAMIVMPQNAPAFIGREAVQAIYNHFFEILKLNVVFTIYEIVCMGGDLAYGRATSAGTQEILAGHKITKEANNELFIFRKEQGAMENSPLPLCHLQSSRSRIMPASLKGVREVGERSAFGAENNGR
jgi:hypothetical protein